MKNALASHANCPRLRVAQPPGQFALARNEMRAFNYFFFFGGGGGGDDGKRKMYEAEEGSRRISNFLAKGFNRERHRARRLQAI